MQAEPSSTLAVFLYQFLGDDTMNKKNGALYIRVSTDKQEELSPDAQIRLLKEFAQKNNIHISKEYVFQDNGISGRKAEKRPEFQRMIGLAKSKEHPIDCIIVWKFSRFARNQEESILYKSLLKKNDVEVISISENTTGEFGTLIERIIEWMDEYYSIRLSGEVIRGMTESAMRGNYMAVPPIGYMSSKGNGNIPQIDDETKIIPLTMKELLYKGKTTRQIAVYCNNKEWRTKRGNMFEARDIEYILMNPFYAGKLRWNYSGRGRKLKPENEVIYADGKWDPLWTYDETLEMSAMITSKRSAIGGSKKTRDVSTCNHWLSGILRCSSCGKSLALGGSKKAKGFQCWNYSKGKCFTSHYISAELISKYVIDGLKDFLQADSISYMIVNQSCIDNDNQIAEYRKELTKLNQREKRAKNAYLDGIDSKEEYKENKAYCENEKLRIEKLMNQLLLQNTQRSKNELDRKMIDNIKDVLLILENPDGDYETKGNAIRSIVDNIVFHRTDTTLDFTFKLYI